VTRIVCVGNRYIDEDSAGPKVFDYLTSRGHPTELDLVDGGLGGLDLLRWMEGVDRVVFVDTVWGIGSPGEVMVLSREQVAGYAPERYEHGAGLAFLLQMLPQVCPGPTADVMVVGIEGPCDQGAVGRAADLALSLALCAPEPGAGQTCVDRRSECL
jgi:hydrogenase maturation protease